MSRWEGFEELVAVVNNGSFSAAAKVLGVSKGHVLGLPQTDIVTPFASDFSGFGVVLNTNHRTVTAQMVEHVACATTDIEDTLVPIRNKPIHHVK